MKLCDSHTHLYLEQFDEDRNEVIERSLKAGVERMLLPNIDVDSIGPMLQLCRQYPKHCFPMMGLHPTSVKADYLEQLKMVEETLDAKKYIAVGEIGMDLYWDKSFRKEQEEAFRFQAGLALKHDLPIVIHARESFDALFAILDEIWVPELKGVFHCFTGSLEQAMKIITEYKFYLGIGGVATFKNGGLDKVIPEIGLEHLLLETDAPYLSPAPFRGKRNESAYVVHVAEKLAGLLSCPVETIAMQTTANAKKLFPGAFDPAF